MTDTGSSVRGRLEIILGPERLSDIAVEDGSDEDGGAASLDALTNAREISCECRTIILRPKHARLIVPSESMIEVERHLSFLKHGDKMFKNLVKGCYWLVDDMYKFEQISYTKEIKTQIQLSERQVDGGVTTASADEHGDKQEELGPEKIASMLPGLRFLACAECNICPLGWFDPRTKESYLYVW